MARGTTSRRKRNARRRNAANAKSSFTVSAPVGDVQVSSTSDAGPGPVVFDFSASGKAGLPLSDREAPWSASAAKKSLEPAQYPQAHFWRDPDGDPETLAAFKLPFAKNDGGLTAVWRGVTAAAGAVQGARGGVSIPEGDVAAVRGKINGYYAAARKKYGDDNIRAPWDDASKASSPSSALAYAEAGHLTVEEYGARLAYWDEQFALTPERAALADAAEALALHAPPGEMAASEAAAEGECVCGHAASMHLGDANDGACTATGCDCAGFEAADTTPDDELDDEASASEPLTLSVQIRPELDLSAIESVTQGLPDDVAATVRVRLEQLTLAQLADVELPDELQPAEGLPVRTAGPPEPDPTPAVRNGTGLRWNAIFVPEATLTDDFRAIAPGALTWRELPLTLMGMVVTSEGGHVGAEVCGRIDEIWRDGNLVRASGIFDDGEFGLKIGELVGDGKLRGVSVDLAIHAYEVGPLSDYFDPDGNWIPEEQRADSAAGAEEPNLVDILFAEEPDEPAVFVITDAVIGASTVCPFPAFAGATIELAASLVAAAHPSIATVTTQGGWVVTEEEIDHAGVVGNAFVRTREALVASAPAGIAPLHPPAEWFADPELGELTPLTITEDGRIYGHAWAWDTCHIGIPDVCTTAPHTATGNAYFHLGEIVCEDGSTRIPCGKITIDAPHADRRLARAEATAHYDHTGAVAAHVVAGEDEFGGWVAGAIHPEISEEKLRLLRGSALSGDWRNVNGNLELVALLAVNVAGFPVPRVRALVASGENGPEVLTLMAAGIPVPPAGILTPAELERFRALHDRAAGRFAALAARARGVAVDVSEQ